MHTKVKPWFSPDMSFLENIQNLPEASRKRIALGAALVLTAIIIGGSVTISSLLVKEKEERLKGELSAYAELYKVGKDTTSDVLYYVDLGWGDIYGKVFGE
jgi:hypothetical protein